jgi:hypothetical protein
MLVFSCAADASTVDFNCSLNDFPEFGPLRSFTPMVSQNGGRSNPFAAGGSSNGYVDRSSLRTSQDISVLLRSGMLMEAALLSSNASRMHVIHDAGGWLGGSGSGWMGRVRISAGWDCAGGLY